MPCLVLDTHQSCASVGALQAPHFVLRAKTAPVGLATMPDEHAAAEFTVVPWFPLPVNQVLCQCTCGSLLVLFFHLQGHVTGMGYEHTGQDRCVFVFVCVHECATSE